MSELGVELLLRLVKVIAASILGVLVYVVLVGPFGVPATAQLAIEAWIVGALLVLLLETNAF